MTSQIQIRGDMGKLSAILQMPENETDKKYPIVIIMHGLMLKKEFHLLESLADNLLSLNIGSIRFDFNGHGESEGDFINMTIPNEIDDARNIYNYICDLKNIGDVSFLGHSQGGFVAAMLSGAL